MKSLTRNDSFFATNPTNLDISRSSFRRNASVKFTFNAGELIPFYVDEVLPGDTFNIKTSKVVRAQTMLTPMMDNLYLDTYYFFVPNRLVWTHWRECMGANYADAWTPEVEYAVPQTTAPTGGWNIGTIADYMGVPTGVAGLSVSSLPFRAYALIWNEWFRDETLSDPAFITLSDSNSSGSNAVGIRYASQGAMPLPVYKYHDYFTSCLPSPQRGPDVQIPVGTGQYPVIPLQTEIPTDLISTGIGYTARNVYQGAQSFAPNTALPYPGINFAQSAGDATQGYQVDKGVATTASTQSLPVISNLWAIDDGLHMAASVNALRLAFGIQRLYEKDARSGGGRYVEIIKAHFGVTSPDARQQRPEYLGGNRLPINVNQVVQQSESATTPQGTPTGLSVTTDSHGDFSKSFTEHGFVIGVCCVRYNHTYQQGLERFWSRRTRFDFYWPGLANIGEQAVLNKEIYAVGPITDSTDDQVFGYQEAWAEYRYKPSRVAGEMRSVARQSLDVWHLADYYSALPRLSDTWKREDKANVDRVLAVTSSVSQQFFADFYVQNKTVRPMPVYSIPGLIDHH